MIRLLSGDARDVLPTLPAESVQCVVTSPPYYGLRDYQTGTWDGGDAGCDHSRPSTKVGTATTLRLDGREHLGLYDGEKATEPGYPFRDTCGKCGAVRVDRQIGLEATLDEYLATMVGVFREVRRVLRRDGVCFVNMGDSYASSGGLTKGGSDFSQWADNGKPRARVNDDRDSVNKRQTGLKPKDLLLMPARLALALQADGWWVRSDIIWHKPNPMPESVTDRPTRSHEYVFLLTKSARYYYDQQGVAEVLDRPEEADRQTPAKFGGALKHVDAFKQSRLHSGNEYRGTPSGTRNARSVWTIATHAYSAAHFATFPPELAERCIRAGTSECGCCAACGKPWGRVTEQAFINNGKSAKRAAVPDPAMRREFGDVQGTWDVTTTGWSPGCDHDAPTVPCTVLDPFAGAGTTLLVADRLQRDAVGIELSPDYTRMAMDRCVADAPLFTSFPPAEPPEDERMADLFTDMAAD